MIIPRKVLSTIAKFCDGESGRYALGGVAVQRNESGKAFVVGTDGRRMMIAELSEPETDQLPFEPVPTERVNGFSTIIPSKYCGLAGAGTKPTRKDLKHKPLLSSVKINEVTANGTVSISSQDTEANGSVSVKAVEGRFPKWQDILKQSDYDVSPVAVEESERKRAVSIDCDPVYLAEAAKALAEISTDKWTRKITLKVPLDRKGMIVLEAEANGVKSTAIVMPLCKD